MNMPNLKKKIKKSGERQDELCAPQRTFGFTSIDDMVKPLEFGAEDALIAVKIALGLSH